MDIIIYTTNKSHSVRENINICWLYIITVTVYLDHIYIPCTYTWKIFYLIVNLKSTLILNSYILTQYRVPQHLILKNAQRWASYWRTLVILWYMSCPNWQKIIKTAIMKRDMFNLFLTRILLSFFLDNINNH